MLKTLLSNPVTRTFIALLVSVAAVLGAFLTYITAPEHFGKTAVQFEIDTIYYLAENWSLAYDYMDFKFLPGTLVIPAYHQGRVVGVLLIPPEEFPGSLSMRLPEEHKGDLPATLEDNLDQILIMLDYTDYKRILRDSGDTILLRADEADESIAGNLPRQYLNRQLEHGHSLLTSYDMFGFTNWLLPTSQTILVRLWGQRLGTLTYYEDARVSISGPDFTINFDHPELESQFYPPTHYKVRAAIYMLFLGLAAAALTAFLTGGVENSQSEVKGEYQKLPTVAALSGVCIYAFLLSGFQMYFQPSNWAVAALWVLPLLLIGVWARQARLEPAFFGITTRGLTAGIVTAVSVSIFVALGATFSLPSGVDWNLPLLVSLGAAAIFREALLRGFCQRIITHWLNPAAGVLLVSGLWAIIMVVTGLSTGSGIVLSLVSALGRSLLIGYLYHRSNNLFAAGLLGALFDLVPRVLLFS